MARSKTPFVKPRVGSQAGSIGRLAIKNHVKASLTGFTKSRDLDTEDLLVSDSSLFVCKVDEGIVGEKSPVGTGRLIPFDDHQCPKYRNNTGVCLLCGSEE